MGNAGSDSGSFRTALRTGSYRLALDAARGLPRVDLGDALDLTLLAAQADPDRFDAMGVRWIARLIEERQVTLHDIEWAAARLSDEREGRDGRTGLRNLLKQRPMRL